MIAHSSKTQKRRLSKVGCSIFLVSMLFLAGTIVIVLLSGDDGANQSTDANVRPSPTPKPTLDVEATQRSEQIKQELTALADNLAYDATRVAEMPWEERWADNVRRVEVVTGNLEGIVTRKNLGQYTWCPTEPIAQLEKDWVEHWQNIDVYNDDPGETRLFIDRAILLIRGVEKACQR